MKHQDATRRYVSRAGFLMGVITMSAAVWAYAPAVKSQDTRTLVASSSTPIVASTHSCRPIAKRYPRRPS